MCHPSRRVTPSLLSPLLAGHAKWQRSVLLQSFAGSFCGAASAFAGMPSPSLAFTDQPEHPLSFPFPHSLYGRCARTGHASDARSLYSGSGALTALKNTLANLVAASVVFLIALEIEQMLATVGTVDVNSDGIVELYEIGVYYGVAAGPACVTKPFNLLGVKIGGGRPC